MRVEEIYNHLNALSPFSLQESWDNSGLMVGSMHQGVSSIALSIDVDEELLESLEENTLLITHHPIIFGGLKQLDFNAYPANLLQIMVQKNIVNIAMHTNFDQTHLNDYVVSEVLGYTTIKKDGFVNYFEIDEDFDSFATKVADAFGLLHVRCVQAHQKISKVALTTGSGCSLMRGLDADCFLTGDIKYHDAMEAKSLNLSLMDIGHYESEHFFGQILEKHLKNLGLKVIITQSKNPFTIKYPKDTNE